MYKLRLTISGAFYMQVVFVCSAMHTLSLHCLFHSLAHLDAMKMEDGGWEIEDAECKVECLTSGFRNQ